MRTPPSPISGSIMIAAVSPPIGALGRSKVGEWHLVEALDDRAEAVEIFLLAAGGERRQRAAVERAFEGDDAVALGPAADRVVLTRRLDRAFHRLGAGIAEEHHVGEARLAQPLGDPFGFGNFVEIGDVPQLVGLLLERGDQMRMRVAERVHGDAGGKIKIALAVGGNRAKRLRPARKRGVHAQRSPSDAMSRLGSAAARQ